MESLTNMSIKLILRDLKQQQNRVMLKIMCRRKKYMKRLYNVLLRIPLSNDCDYDLVDVLYPLTLKEILTVYKELSIGYRVNIKRPPIRQKHVKVMCVIKFNRDLYCNCYNCDKYSLSFDEN